MTMGKGKGGDRERAGSPTAVIAVAILALSVGGVGVAPTAWAQGAGRVRVAQITPGVTAWLSDELTVRAGKARLRVVHALPSASEESGGRLEPFPLDVYALDIDVDVELEGERREGAAPWVRGTVDTLFVFRGEAGRARGLLLVDAEAPSGLPPAVWLGLALWALLLARFVWVHRAP